MKNTTELPIRFWNYFNDREWALAETLLSEDFEAIWPQSKERIVGAKNFIEVNRTYPGTHKIEILNSHQSYDNWEHFHHVTTEEMSNQMFLDCLSSSEKLSDNGEMKSFALQHHGKNLFDQKRYDEALKHFYEAMMIRVRLKRDDLADSSRLALDKVASILFPPPPLDRQIEILGNTQTPDFVRLVNGKKYSEISQSGRPNCINAIINFFDRSPYDYETAQTSTVLEFLKKECEQIEEPLKKEVGTVVVFWSRSGGAWDNKKIVVKDMNDADATFPYGLVFEHIAVFVDSEIVFHKPSPAIAVPYKLDFFDSAVGVLKYAKGFETTWHLKRSRL